MLPVAPMPIIFRRKRAQKVVRKEGVTARSLGFVPLLLMTLGYVLLTYFAEAIGPMTSAPGFWQPGSHDPIRRGCIIPRATE